MSDSLGRRIPSMQLATCQEFGGDVQSKPVFIFERHDLLGDRETGNAKIDHLYIVNYTFLKTFF